MSSQADLILDWMPDWGTSEKPWGQAEDWLNRGRQQVLGFAIESVDWDRICLMECPDEFRSSSKLGYYSNSNFRKWILGLFLADLVSYSVSSDQVEFHRLAYLAATFPQGFRLAWLNISGEWWPVGYTGWYPISSSAFETLKKRPETLQDRMIVPLLQAKAPYLYLFNYSVAPSLKKTMLSKALMSRYAQDVAAQSPAGLSAITVSEEGSRVASRFGMTQTGEFKIGDEIERVFTS